MAIILNKDVYIILFTFATTAYSNFVFQPAFITASGPKVTAYLVGNTTGVSLTLTAVQPSNTTGLLPAPSCSEDEPGQWTLTSEAVAKDTLKIVLNLNRSLQLCSNGTDCCSQPLCVLQTLRVLACVGGTPQATLLVQAEVYALLLSSTPVSFNKTVIPNQAYEPLGPCPCDLTLRRCDILCCCDQDCSQSVLRLFEPKCFPAPFGGNATPTPDYQCSDQSSRNEPDWFPFLCVTSPPDNSPFLGLFFQGETITPTRILSFVVPALTAPLPSSAYRQGSPIFTVAGQYFTVPQLSLVGQCVDSAPVAFLQNFRVWCPVHLLSCPAPPVLRLKVRDGLGGVITVIVEEVLANDISPFVSDPGQAVKLSSTKPYLFSWEKDDTVPGLQQRPGEQCQNVTLALDYTFYWRANGLTEVVVVRTVGDVALGVPLAVRFSAVFINGNASAQPNSGNPGYIIGKPILGGSVDKDTGIILRMPVSLWQPVGEGLCALASTKPVLFGQNATSGCLVRLGVQNLTQCSQLRDAVSRALGDLVTAQYVAINGNPDALNLADWVNITFISWNATSPEISPTGSCKDIPSHLNIQVYSTVIGRGVAQQRLIQAMEVSYTLTTWRVECGGGDPQPCQNASYTQAFPVTSAVTFIDVPAQSPQPKTRFQINFTEYDCDKNDVCWPQLMYPLTRYYTGEPYSMCLAKGLILVCFFITASLLGTPWRQIRQAYSSTLH